MKAIVSIIGAGAIGTVIGKGLDKRQVSVSYLDKEESKIRYASELEIHSFEFAIAHSDIIFICIPSKQVRGLLEKISTTKEGVIVICLAKGIESGSLLTMDLLITEVLGKSVKPALLYGPMLAKEIMNGQPGYGHLAIKDKAAYDKVKVLFDPYYLGLTYSDDMYSIAIAGVLKNIYALAFGMADGFGYENNVKGQLVVLAIREMKLILKSIAHLTDEVEYSFLSDLVATGFSDDSRNHTVGKMLALEGKRMESEGTVSIPSIVTLVSNHLESLPMLRRLYSIFEQKQSPLDEFKKILTI